MQSELDRREWLGRVGGAALGGVLMRGTSPASGRPGTGVVIGQPQAAQAGAEVLAAGGNAVDAAVAGALVAGVVAVNQCGIGGYGGHLVIARPDGKTVTAIDFNTAAPATARPDLYPLDARGNVKGQVNRFGWLSAGVPGTLAGLQLALDRYGTRPFAELVRPAIRHARDGFEVTAGVAAATRTARPQLLQDPASARLLLNRGEPLQQGATFKNPDLADLLQTLAERKSVESFYRGDIGVRIAAAFQKHGGLVTAEDMASYRAREVEPLRLEWRGHDIRTAPLTAGGLSVLEALAVFKALDWDREEPGDPATDQARVEALRLVWDDRLKLLGDPEQADVPVARLLSDDHARRLADRVKAAVREGRPVSAEGDGRPAGGTIHLSAADASGMLVALTLTHGEAFGARVTVEGLGLLLGHGLSRFDPRPGRPNSPGPGKRPLHNMCPTVVLRGGRPVLAVGATGGRRIPNTLIAVLSEYVGRGARLDEAVKAPRLHTEGDRQLTVEASTPEAVRDRLTKVGYDVKTGPGATIQAVAFDPAIGACTTATR